MNKNIFIKGSLKIVNDDNSSVTIGTTNNTLPNTIFNNNIKTNHNQIIFVNDLDNDNINVIDSNLIINNGMIVLGRENQNITQYKIGKKLLDTDYYCDKVYVYIERDYLFDLPRLDCFDYGISS